MRCEAIVLAAGLGTRMNSAMPKVLQPLGGWPLLRWSVEACRQATGEEPHVVIPPEADEIRQAVGNEVHFVVQAEPLGTGHAALQAAGALNGKSELLLVTSADMPLLTSDTLRGLIEVQQANVGPVTLLTTESDPPRGFGRVERDPRGKIVGIIEEAQASPVQLGLKELNVGAYCFRAAWLWEQLPKVQKSAKGEYYLTDLVGLATASGQPIAVLKLADPNEAIGINTLEHLAEAEAAIRRRINRELMAKGVRFLDPETTYVEAGVRVASDTVLLPNTHLQGETVIGSGCQIGPNSILRNAQVGDRCRIEASVVEGAVLEQDVEVGPFARLRPGARLGAGVHVGNFGEIKSSTLGPGVKVGHFSYLGDATIGKGVNIGAGTITCNFDGKQKHATTIGEGAFIGSDTMLVAPVNVGAGARTGAGAVVTKDVPANTLAAGVPARVIRKLNPRD